MKEARLTTVKGLRISLAFILSLAAALSLADLTRAGEDELYEASQTLIKLKKELRAEKARRINDKIDSYNRRKDLEAQIRSLERGVEDLRIIGLRLENEVLELDSEREEIHRETEGL